MKYLVCRGQLGNVPLFKASRIGDCVLHYRCFLHGLRRKWSSVGFLSMCSRHDMHGVCVQGHPGVESLMLAALLALLYVAAWFYSRNLPERWRPGAYDLFGNSHQIMHTLVRFEVIFFQNKLITCKCVYGALV